MVSTTNKGEKEGEVTHTAAEIPNKELKELLETPLAFFFHSSMCLAFASASFFAYSSGMSFPE